MVIYKDVEELILFDDEFCVIHECLKFVIRSYHLTFASSLYFVNNLLEERYIPTRIAFRFNYDSFVEAFDEISKIRDLDLSSDTIFCSCVELLYDFFSKIYFTATTNKRT